MVRFLDGPAEGVRLPLQNAPYRMRVVRSAHGDWDAVDRPGDETPLDWEVFIYRRTSYRGFAPWRYRTTTGQLAEKIVMIADYRFVPNE